MRCELRRTLPEAAQINLDLASPQLHAARLFLHPLQTRKKTSIHNDVCVPPGARWRYPAATPPAAAWGPTATQGEPACTKSSCFSNRPSTTLFRASCTCCPHTQTVYLIRHGEGFHNVGMDHNLDAHLTPRGWAQTAALNQHLQAHQEQLGIQVRRAQPQARHSCRRLSVCAVLTHCLGPTRLPTCLPAAAGCGVAPAQDSRDRCWGFWRKSTTPSRGRSSDNSSGSRHATARLDAHEGGVRQAGRSHSPDDTVPAASSGAPSSGRGRGRGCCRRSTGCCHGWHRRSNRGCV